MPADTVLAKDLRERSTSVLTLSLGVGLLTFGALGVYAGMADTLDELTQAFPEELLTFIGGDGPGGYVVGEVFHLIAPLALVSYAVVTGASATAGEEQRKTLGLLLGVPISRGRVLAAKTGGMLAAVAVISALFLASVLAASAAFDVGLARGNVVAAVVHLTALVAFFGSLALLAGATTGQPGMAAGIAGAVALVSYLSASMLPLAGLDRWAELSPWFYYAGSGPLSNGLEPVHLLVLGVLTLVSLAGATWTFARRDLRG